LIPFKELKSGIEAVLSNSREGLQMR
jgi:hypothetical protein